MGANAPSQIERMRAQGYTEEEIEDMLKCDKEIDRGADLFPLDPSLEAGAKKVRRADRTDTPKKAVRERKTDVDKLLLSCHLRNGLENGLLITDFEIVNPEREFLFTYNGKKYKVVLSAPRS